MAVCLESRALVAGSRGQLVRAARLFGAAATLRAEVGVRWRPWLRADFERCGVAIRTALGESAFEAARIAGSALTREEAFAEALTGSGSEPRVTHDGTARG